MTVQPSRLFSVLEITGPLRAGASNIYLGAEKLAIFRFRKNTLLSSIIDLGGPCYPLKGIQACIPFNGHQGEPISVISEIG